MQITLTKEHEDWLREQVAAGRFASTDDAVRFAITGLVAAQEADDDDDDYMWAKPLIDEGIADLDAGRSYTSAEVLARIEASLKRRA
jgi:antitoxin ParD1/3/4